jgi:pimeloyl-ACP methyl ester carboxylesterase
VPYVPTAVTTGFRVLSAVAPPAAIHLGARLIWRVGPRAPVRDADAPVHERGVRRTIEVGGEQIVTYRWGDPRAPAVLLVHGWQSRASRFARLIGALESAGLHVVAFDGVAHGASTGRRMSALDHVAVIQALDGSDGPFDAVVGHSLGGLAAGLALHDGVRAERLVSLSAMTGFDAVVESFRHLVGIPDQLHDRFSTRVESTFPGDALDARTRIDLAHRTVPHGIATLFVHDDGDRLAMPSGARRLHAAHPGSTLLTTTGLGHTRILDDDAVLAAVVAHVVAPRGATRDATV